ncbi:MAG: shikimate dehydrogenase [Candidatus Micrarchaeota archaeon]|nr:shikimate dehydrogenase [Candidatus Micrarchaeota archaeon]
MSSIIGPHTKLCCLIGDPVEHSMSPAMHNAAFNELGLDYAYLAFKVPKEKLKDAVAGIKALGFAGANVTIPHKMDVVRHLDEVDSLAQQIGAVNTIVNEDGRLTGYNTDGEGALQALSDAGIDLKGRRVAVIGAGGAAHAITFTFAKKARLQSLAILNIIEADARNLAQRVKAHTGAFADGMLLNAGNLEKAVEQADVLVNATSVGMNPKASDSPVPKELLHKGLAVFDVVYNPLETRLVREAREKGCVAVTGEKMLVNQGAKSFELWTGRTPPVEKMLAVVRNALGAK